VEFSKAATKLTVGFFLLWLLTLGAMIVVRHSVGEELRKTAYYAKYSARRDLALRPVTLATEIIAIAYGMFWVFRKRERQINPYYRLAVLAFVLLLSMSLLLVLIVPL
jgi:hypothetical protein